MTKGASLIPVERIERSILLIRGQKVILNKDLAILYQVSTGNLNKAVSRNLGRFPEDFMFQLTEEEFTKLMFHFGRSTWGGTRKLPRAFTEQGVAMLSSVLRSNRAVSVNIEIMRAFVRLRQMLSTNANLERRLNELEKKYDSQLKVVFDAIRQLMKKPEPSKKWIGFHLKEQHSPYMAKVKKRHPN
ncbi:MAG: ORF6N domain-containing protein [Deltaproteobacteria bacterium]|nr:ORF6N domain-containing protein [Deltaproteobacteria bacterium]